MHNNLSWPCLIMLKSYFIMENKNYFANWSLFAYWNFNNLYLICVFIWKYFVQDKKEVQHQISILLFVGLTFGVLMVLFTQFLSPMALTGIHYLPLVKKNAKHHYYRIIASILTSQNCHVKTIHSASPKISQFVAFGI